MTARKISAAAALGAAVMFAGGCSLIDSSETWEPQKADAISISADGQVTEIVQETLDENYYDSSELKSLIDSSVAEYNQTCGEDRITEVSFEVSGQNVTLTLTYASAEDFASFNNMVLYSGTLINAQMEGYLFDTSFYKISDGSVSGSAVDDSEAIKNMAAQVLIVQGPIEVHIEGADIIMISTNAEMLSSDTVYASGSSSEDNTELVLPSNAVYTGAKKTLAEKKKAKRVYIFYETE